MFHVSSLRRMIAMTLSYHHNPDHAELLSQLRRMRWSHPS
jgi:hypothetical protein